jgi:hypothetical protein
MQEVRFKQRRSGICAARRSRLRTRRAECLQFTYLNEQLYYALHSMSS